MPARILIADRSSALRAVIERAIGVAGLPVSGCRQAANAKEVLDLLQSSEIDLLLLDTHLPGIDEEQLIEALNASGDGPPIRFLATSADASSVRIERLLQAGACDYVLKPFSMPTLCARLETALGMVYAGS